MREPPREPPNFIDRPDARPVQDGDLVAAIWFDDPNYYYQGKVGHLNDGSLYIDTPTGIGLIAAAHHVVLLERQGLPAEMVEGIAQAQAERDAGQIEPVDWHVGVGH